jgi:hypothetical protein
MKRGVMLFPLILLLTACSSSISSPPPPVQTSPTPTSPPPLLSTATLGGVEQAFQAAFGSPNTNNGLKTYIFTLSGVRGLVSIIPRGQLSSDGKEHIAGLQIGPSDDSSWDAATALPICAQFTPFDARYVKTKKISSSSQQRVYVSAELAKVFPPGDFQNGATLRPDPPGTFSMQLGPDYAPTSTGCILLLGS